MPHRYYSCKIKKTAYWLSFHDPRRGETHRPAGKSLSLRPFRTDASYYYCLLSAKAAIDPKLSYTFA